MSRSLIILLTIILIAALLRFPLTSQGFFAFNYDQGRDLLQVKQIVEDHKLTLIGPTTGLPGIFYGPWWYYFLSPLFLITNGNPTQITLAFGLIGILSIIFLYYLVTKITNSTPIALLSTAIAAMSQTFLTASAQMWSPSLVIPLMTIYTFCVYKIFQKANSFYFLTLGIINSLIFDSETAFGLMLTISTIINFIIFKKTFLKKSALFYLLGYLIILLPRIIFDLKHNFLITSSVIAYIKEPKIYQQQLNLLERLVNRINVFYFNFAQTFSQSNKITALLTLLIILAGLYLARAKLKKDNFLKFLISSIFIIYLAFSIYPDALWDYYLVGLPLVYIIIFAISFSTILKYSKHYIYLAILILLFNFAPKLLDPFSITWQGDGAIYRNQVRVMDTLKNDLHGNYSLYVYTPARFDYPFEYLIYKYHKDNKIDLPQDNQKRIFLIIRDDNSHSYLPTGWYGDKLKDKTTLVDKQTLPGSIIIEKHILND